MGGGGDDGGASQQRADEAARQARITAGTADINNKFDAQFTPDFYTKQYQNYLDYASPQLNDQYAKAQKSLTFALDRAGILNSSARAQQEADLLKLYNTNMQNVTNQALGYKTKAMSDVESARDNLISTLNATGDAEQAAKAATNQAANLSQPATYSTLGDLFSSFTNTLANSASAYQNAALMSKYTNTGNTATNFGGGSNAVKVS